MVDGFATRRGARGLRAVGLALTVVLAGAGTWASPVAEGEGASAGSTAEIRIALPEDGTPRVSVAPGRDRVRLDLPAGARFPTDFVASSQGMLREGRVEFVDDRVTIDLELALGALDRIDFEPDALVLQFRSSRLPSLDTADPQQRYVLGPDDRISLLVHNRPELSPALDITRDGWITAPLVGQVKAAGLTPPQLAARLSQLYADGYLKDPQVDVSVLEYRSQWVVVSGEVKAPGRKALRGGTRLKEILGEAEGFTPEAGEEIQISRKVPGTEEVRTLYVSRTDFERGVSNPSLAHGDTIDVRRAEHCYIQGEVRTSGRVRIERGLTLLRVIAMAGGLTDWADRKNILVLYPEGVTPREQIFNLNKIQEGRVPDPVIRGGEDIVVRKRFL
jgi:polysaccharide export outer membrane protein